MPFRDWLNQLLPATLATAAVAAGTPARAQGVPGGNQVQRGTAAVLFRYEPHAGKEDAHAEAYKRHLDWHRRNGDPLDWWAWRVESGPRSGDFVDGTFGITWPMFERRIKPAEDGTDFARTAGPLARPLGSQHLELLPRLSRLKSATPAPVLDVVTVELAPGSEAAFEAFVQKTTPPGGDLGWYRVLDGPTLPTYLLVLPRATSLGGVERAADYWRWLGAQPGAHVDRWVRSLHSETWSYLPDLSSFPNAPSPAR